MATKKILRKVLLNGEQYHLPWTDWEFVDLESNQSIDWVKTFLDEPVLPAKSSTATTSTTAPATEKQVYDVAQSVSTLDWAVVKTSWNQTVNGVKTFGSEPVLPSKTSAATNSWTAPATEAQVKAVADAIPTVDSAMSDSSTNPVQNKIVKAYVDQKVVWIYDLKGSKATFADLPSTWNVKGDCWNIEASFTLDWKTYPAWTNVVWTWTEWDPLGWQAMDTSGFVTTNTAQNITAAKTFTVEPVLPTKSTDATNDWTKPATEAQVYKKLDSSDLWNATISVTEAWASAWSFTTNQSTAWTLALPWNKILTQSQYDDLPASKATDWNWHWIYETVTVE